MTNSTNRRGVLKGIAGVLGLATATVTTVAVKTGNAATPVPLSEAEAFKLECDKFNEPLFNAGAYIDFMLASKSESDHPAIYVTHGRETGFSGWLPHLINDGWGHNDCNVKAFKAELRRRRLFMVWSAPGVIDYQTGKVTQRVSLQPIRPNMFGHQPT